MKREAFFDRDASHYYCEDGKAVGAYCREQFPEDVAQTLAVADGVCRKYFLFNSKWDLEQTDEPVQFDGAIDWTYMPADDPEFVWQFNRHRFFMTLGQAYQMTGDEKYARAFMEIAEDWIDHVPLNEKYAAGPWRSLDTGFRGEYWSKAIWLFHDSPTLTEAFLQKYYDSMILQAEHIMECHSAYRYMSNWGVIENHGLFEIGVCLPQSEKTKQFIAFAVKNLEVQVRMQIMPDGVHWEQSPMYHNEVLHCLLDVILLAKSIDGVYDSDPKDNPDAKKYEEVSIQEVIDKDLKVVDMTASILCKENKMPMLVFGLNQENSIVDTVNGTCNGTRVTV